MKKIYFFPGPSDEGGSFPATTDQIAEALQLKSPAVNETLVSGSNNIVGDNNRVIPEFIPDQKPVFIDPLVATIPFATEEEKIKFLNDLSDGPVEILIGDDEKVHVTRTVNSVAKPAITLSFNNEEERDLFQDLMDAGQLNFKFDANGSLIAQSPEAKNDLNESPEGELPTVEILKSLEKRATGMERIFFGRIIREFKEVPK